jgi:hypothetical protein
MKKKKEKVKMIKRDECHFIYAFILLPLLQLLVLLQQVLLQLVHRPQQVEEAKKARSNQ